MSEIKVGDRVYRWLDCDAGYVLRATCGPWAWIERDDGTFRTVHFGSLALSRIEPEPVTLTPRLKVGQRVQTNGLQLAVTADNIYVVKNPAVGYELESGGWLPESLLYPVPAPCPTCKGTGKSE